MTAVLIILAVLVFLALLWVLSLRCKRSSGDFYGLSVWHYAHRGLHDRKIDVPENSLLAFHRAVERGYGAELDVHLTKDGKLAVIHDESLKRTAGADKMVCDCTLEELKSYRLEGTSEPIPELSEVFEIFAGKAPLIVELKAHGGNHRALSQAVCKLLDEYPSLSYCSESFYPRVVRWFKKNRPEIIRGQLSCNLCKEPGNLPLLLCWVLRNLFLNFLTVPHFIAYSFEDRKNPALWICHKIWGVKKVSWTLRKEEDGQQALQENCTIIFESYCPETRRSNVR